MTKDLVTPSGEVPDLFDRTLAGLIGRPGVLSTKPTTRQTVPPLGIGGVQTWIVRTFRVQDDGTSDDLIMLECYDGKGQTRLVIPTAIADSIARQREALTAKSRTAAARKVAADRKARGEVPAFLREKGWRKKGGK